MCVRIVLPGEGQGFKGKEDCTLALIRQIQVRGRKIILRAFQTTAGAALDIELFLQPVNIQLDIFFHDAPLRIVTNLTYKYITKCPKTTSQPRNVTATTKEMKQHFTRLSPFYKQKLYFTAICHHNLKNLECRILFPTLP